MIKLKHYVVYGMLLSVVLNQTVLYTNASANTELTKEFQDFKKHAIASEALYFEETEGKTYAKDSDGILNYGWQYDANGNLYYINEDTGMIKSAANKDGIYFDENGQYINPSMVNPELNHELSKRFETGERLYFNSNEELLNFLEYYSAQYRLLDDADGYSIKNYANGSNSIVLPDSEKYDREKLKQGILQKFAPIKGDTPYEKIMDACQKITGSMKYDLSYIDATMWKAISDEKGVCHQYTKILKVLMDEEGITNEIMIGNTNGKGHMWLRCFIDGQWSYVDPTAVQSIWWSYVDIPYRLFVETYCPIRGMQIE